MSLIQMTAKQGLRYRYYLNVYRIKFNKEPDAQARTEAFFCARSNDPWKFPDWCK